VLYLRGDGNVGMGTNDPAYKLDVVGTIGADTIIADTTQGGAISGTTGTFSGNLTVNQGYRLLMSGQYNEAGPQIQLDRSGLTTWGTVAHFDAFRFLETQNSSGSEHTQLLRVGAGGVAITSPGADYAPPSYARAGTHSLYCSGNVGIGTNDPGYKLVVAGDIYATGNVTAYSDIRKKKNLQIIETPIEKVKELNGYTYEIDERRYTGLVAQEVLKVLPEAVVGDEEKGYGLAYGNMAGLFVEALKDLKSQLDSALVRISELEKHLS